MTARAWMGISLTLLLLTAAVGAQMPDARQMSGIPLPSGDVPAGSVSVRLVRGTLTNAIAGHPVELHAGDKTQTARTDPDGRAVFSGLLPGLPIHVTADVDGEKLDSQTFSLSPDAGVRLVLAAGVGSGPAAGGPTAAPPAGIAPGEVAFGGDSRIQIEFEDDTMEVFYLLEVVNPASTAVNPKQEIVFELPDGAEQAALLEGSSTQASVKGRVVTIMGPFAPGTTPVQLAYSLGPAGAERSLVQQLPITWTRVQVIMTRAGAAAMSSPQFSNVTPTAADNQNFVFGVGGALAGGQALSLSFTGLPSRSRWGAYAAVALAVLILVWGAATAFGRQATSGAEARRAQLLERRDRLMADLVRVEQQFRSGTLDAARHGARKAELMAQLERVYGELDEHGGTAEGLPA